MRHIYFIETKDMNQKKFFSVALLATTVLVCLLTVFSSCSSDDDPSSNYVYYIADGTLSSTGNLGALFAIAEYNSAIKEVTGEDYKEVDSKVIAACDAVYASHRANYNNIQGEVTITKRWLTDDSKSTVIKTYKYE